MDEMIRYIFGSLRCSESAMRAITKTLSKQKSFNHTVSLFVVLTTVQIMIHNMEITALRDKLHNLKKEIKELKNTEGD